MLKILKRFLITIFAFIVLVYLAVEFLPTKTDLKNFDYTIEEIPDDIDRYLELQENEVSGLRDNSKKQIIWANEKKKTPISILYIHGFSSSKQEIRPVPDLVAKHFDENCFLRGWQDTVRAQVRC